MSGKQRGAANGRALDDVEFEPKTDLGRELCELRKRIVASGIPLLDREGLACEIADRRGSLVVVKDGSDLL